MSDTAIDTSNLKVGELRTMLREKYANQEAFVGEDSTRFSQFVNLGRREELDEAVQSGVIPAAALSRIFGSGDAPTDEAKAEADGKPVASQAAMANSPMAFMQQALDAARAEGEAKAVAEMQKKQAPLLAEIETLKSQVEAMNDYQNQQAAAGATGGSVQIQDPNDPSKTIDIGQSTAMPVISGGRHGGIKIPVADKFYVLQAEKEKLLDYAAKRSVERRCPTAVLLVGPKGCGKTTTPEQWSHRRARPFYKINAALVREAKEWFGSKTALNGSLYFIQSEFARAIETPNCSVLVDEINRAIPQGLNALLDLFSSGETYIEEMGRFIKAAPGVVFFATMNVGGEYHVHELDGALSDRHFARLECSYLEEADEVTVVKNKAGVDTTTAKQMVSMANTIRSKTVDASGVGGTIHETLSTRQLVEVAAAYKQLGKESLTYTVINRYSPVGGRDSEQAQVAAIVQAVFG